MAYEDIILSNNHTTNQGKTAFHLVDDSVTVEQTGGNCKTVWQKLTHLPKTAPSYIKLKKEFANSTLGDASTPPDTFCRGDKEVNHAIIFSATIQLGRYSPILISFFSQLGYTVLSCNIQALAAFEVVLPALQFEQITRGHIGKREYKHNCLFISTCSSHILSSSFVDSSKPLFLFSCYGW